MVVPISLYRWYTPAVRSFTWQWNRLLRCLISSDIWCTHKVSLTQPMKGHINNSRTTVVQRLVSKRQPSLTSTHVQTYYPNETELQPYIIHGPCLQLPYEKNFCGMSLKWMYRDGDTRIKSQWKSLQRTMNGGD